MGAQVHVLRFLTGKYKGKSSADLDDFHKFNPPVGAGIRRYAVAQFGVAIGLVLWVGEVFASEGAAAVVIPCVFLWILVLSLGFLNEAINSAKQDAELSRFGAGIGADFVVWEYRAKFHDQTSNVVLLAGW